MTLNAQEHEHADRSQPAFAHSLREATRDRDASRDAVERVSTDSVAVQRDAQPEPSADATAAPEAQDSRANSSLDAEPSVQSDAPPEDVETDVGASAGGDLPDLIAPELSSFVLPPVAAQTPATDVAPSAATPAQASAATAAAPAPDSPQRAQSSAVESTVATDSRRAAANSSDATGSATSDANAPSEVRITKQQRTSEHGAQQQSPNQPPPQEDSTTDERHPALRIVTDAAPAVARAAQIDSTLAAEQAGATPATPSVSRHEGAPNGTASATDTSLPPLAAPSGARPNEPSMLSGTHPASGAALVTAGGAGADTESDAETSPLVARGLAALAQQRGGTLAMRLDPPSLGDLRVTLTITNGTVTADLMPTNAAAHNVLTAGLAVLREALEHQGLVVERLSVHAPPPRSEAAAPQPAAAQVAPKTETRDEPRPDARGDSGAGDRSRSQHDAGGGASRGKSDRRDEAERSTSAPPRRRASFVSAMRGALPTPD